MFSTILTTYVCHPTSFVHVLIVLQQAYVFRGMMVNEFGYRTYDCGDGCLCMYQTELASQCKIDGRGVLEQYGYETGNTGKWVGISLGILAGYRILGWMVTYLRKT